MDYAIHEILENIPFDFLALHADRHPFELGYRGRIGGSHEAIAPKLLGDKQFYN